MRRGGAGRIGWSPTPQTAPIVRWMFAQRLAGQSLARLARALNDMQVPCPSAADPQHNPHRSGGGWSVSTVRSILANSRYTGREVWNRQPSAHDLIDPGNTGLGHRQAQRWSLPEDWAISERPVHEALVSEADFVAVQGVRARRDHPCQVYLLAGLLRCGLCGRRLESCWANGRAAYRCRHGHTSASRPDPRRPKNLYVREDHLLARLPALYLLLTTDLADLPEEQVPGAEDVIGWLHARRIELVYDQRTRSLRADLPGTARVIVDQKAG
ncbi:recombinase family protein [Actinocorallia sp. B10E7]|uniref:recombinase family protein n=1 Tax=Actinocorallia sp. B10E7 TaxID=3153558 RepID=UPI00325C7F1E